MAGYEVSVGPELLPGLLNGQDGLAKLVEAVLNQILEAQVTETLSPPLVGDSADVLCPAVPLHWRQGAIMYKILHYLRQEYLMSFSANDIVPLSQARAKLSELADAVKGGAEKIITKNGESYVALIDANRLDYYHRLESERIHLLLIDEAAKGLDDVAGGRVCDARKTLKSIQQRRRAA